MKITRLWPIAIGLTLVAGSFPSAASAQPYYVGAATVRIDPDAPGSPLAAGTAVRIGGNGFGDGSVIPGAVASAGSIRSVTTEHVSARAVVVDDGNTAIALVTVETQGMFAAYQRGIPGLIDIAQAASARTNGALPAGNIVISNDHTHSGPDMIGAWGFVPDAYARFISAQTTEAIVQAYNARESVNVVAGADLAPDLIYNMGCTEALNQSQNDHYPGNICDPGQENKDSWLRLFQARRTTDASVVATVMSYAAHSTLGGAGGLHGDWPQFMSERLAATYGGTGIAIEGAVGRTQPCRPRCGFTKTSNPGYTLTDRRDAYTTMLMAHVGAALSSSSAVSGPVRASKTFIRHEVSNPVLLGATQHGALIGAPIARSLDAPWTVGNTVLTPVSAMRIGDLLMTGAPGEAYPNIPAAVDAATGFAASKHWTIGLADDQLGYLIANTEHYPVIAAQIAVNDNALFNVSPTIGDHVLCAQIRLAVAVGIPTIAIEPRCAAWDAVDSAGDPLGS